MLTVASLKLDLSVLSLNLHNNLVPTFTRTQRSFGVPVKIPGLDRPADPFQSRDQTRDPRAAVVQNPLESLGPRICCHLRRFRPASSQNTDVQKVRAAPQPLPGMSPIPRNLPRLGSRISRASLRGRWDPNFTRRCSEYPEPTSPVPLQRSPSLSQRLSKCSRRRPQDHSEPELAVARTGSVRSGPFWSRL